MADDTARVPEVAPSDELSGPMVAFFALSVGLIVVNLFAPQTLVGVLSAAFHAPAASAGLFATATPLGYALGLFGVVPLADRFENRALVTRLLIAAAAAALLTGLAPTTPAILAGLFLLGLACSSIQILVPIAAGLVSPDRRGRIIGDITAGLMVGVLLSRPLASLTASVAGWRAFYLAQAVVLLAVAAILRARLPVRRPSAQTPYLQLLASIAGLLRAEPVLRRRGAMAFLLMAAFSIYWSGVGLRLAQPPFRFDQRAIGLFALVGVGGAFGAPLAGRAGDRGWSAQATVTAHILVALAMAFAAWGGRAGLGAAFPGLVALGASAILLDVGQTSDQMLGRRQVNLLHPEHRARLNGAFVGLTFLGGALGSMTAGLAWARWGWVGVCGSGALFALATLVLDLTGRIARPQGHTQTA